MVVLGLLDLIEDLEFLGGLVQKSYIDGIRYVDRRHVGTFEFKLAEYLGECLEFLSLFHRNDALGVGSPKCVVVLLDHRIDLLVRDIADARQNNKQTLRNDEQLLYLIPFQSHPDEVDQLRQHSQFRVEKCIIRVERYEHYLLLHRRLSEELAHALRAERVGELLLLVVHRLRVPLVRVLVGTDKPN